MASALGQRRVSAHTGVRPYGVVPLRVRVWWLAKGPEQRKISSAENASRIKAENDFYSSKVLYRKDTGGVNS